MLLPERPNLGKALDGAEVGAGPINGDPRTHPQAWKYRRGEVQVDVEETHSSGAIPFGP